MAMGKGDKSKMSKQDKKRADDLIKKAREASTDANPSTVREAVNELNSIRERYGLIKRQKH